MEVNLYDECETCREYRERYEVTDNADAKRKLLWAWDEHRKREHGKQEMQYENHRSLS